MFPPPSPDVGLLARVRDALAAADFTESVVRERAKLTSIHDFQLGWPERMPAPPEDAADALTVLFMDGGVLPRARILDLLGPALAADLAALELLSPAPDDPEALRATVALYPIEGLYVASDRGDEFPFGRADAVFPAINGHEREYLALLPRAPCGSFLEVCSGAGIAALIAARSAGHVWASDIGERSTCFARFNARLNGIENVTAVQGDLYQSLEGLRFDVIVAHPPYVPSLDTRQLYRDGGPDGESLTRRVVAEAAAYLEPGGWLYCTCTATEREDQPLEMRVREMLGPAAPDFDVLVLATGMLPPIMHFTREHLLGRHTLQETATLVKTFEELKITLMTSCTIVLHKHAGYSAPVTLRRQRNGEVGLSAAIAGALRWESLALQEGTLDRLAEARPRISPRARLQVSHAAEDGAWKTKGCRVVLDSPLPTALDASPNAALFLAWCDGSHTVRELAERLIAEGIAPPEEPVRALAALVLPLLREGILEAELPPG